MRVLPLTSLLFAPYKPSARIAAEPPIGIITTSSSSVTPSIPSRIFWTCDAVQEYAIKIFAKLNNAETRACKSPHLEWNVAAKADTTIALSAFPQRAAVHQKPRVWLQARDCTPESASERDLVVLEGLAVLHHAPHSLVLVVDLKIPKRPVAKQTDTQINGQPGQG